MCKKSRILEGKEIIAIPNCYDERIFYPQNEKEDLLVVFGESKEDYFTDLDIECVRIGYVQDERSMSEIYNLADIFISPSKQETFGFTVCESMACGTPVVAFPVGGLKEQITHKQDGYLANLFDHEDIARGIEYCRINKPVLGEKAAESAKKYSLMHVGDKWIQLIERLSES